MRTAVGGAKVFEIVIIFMLIFVGYLTIMINYSTAFKTKNEFLSMIEKYEGLRDGEFDPTSGTAHSIWIINKYLANTGYKVTNDCPSGWWGANDLSGGAQLKLNATNAYYCVKPSVTCPVSGGIANEGYYDIMLFLKFDLPVLGRIGGFTVKGQTNKLKYMQVSGLEGCTTI